MYQYGDSWERYPMQAGEVWGWPDGSRVAVHDLFAPLPPWLRADLVFVDPPYNKAQYTGYYSKADLPRPDHDYNTFMQVLLARVAAMGARTLYVEMGSQTVAAWHGDLQRLYPHVQLWPVTYYRKHPTWLLRGSHGGPTDYDYSGQDEAACIRLIAQRETYAVYGDPCMGRGLVGLAAYAAGKPFVGTELNPRRLAVLLDKLAQRGATVARLA